MSKTLIQLMKEATTKLNNVEELKAKIQLSNAEITLSYNEINDRFAPKHLLGKELVIAQGDVKEEKGYGSDTYKEKSKELIEQGIFPRNWAYTKNVSNNIAGKQVKVEAIHLLQIDHKATDTLVWVITAVVKNNNGEYGLRKVSTYLFDKVELTD